MQNVQVFLQEMDNFTVNVPELKLLRQYHADAVLWISRFKNILLNICEREDQHNVVAELESILKDGESLRIQGLPFLFLVVFACRCQYYYVPFFFCLSQFYFHFYTLKGYGLVSEQVMNCLLLRLSCRRLVAGLRP